MNGRLPAEANSKRHSRLSVKVAKPLPSKVLLISIKSSELHLKVAFLPILKRFRNSS